MNKIMELEEGWVFSRLLEEGHSLGDDAYATREEALAAARLEYPDKSVQTGRRWSAKQEMPCVLDAERDCDDAEYDEWNEALIETWRDMAFAPGVIDDLQKRLEKVWDEWSTEHKLVLDVYYVEDIETHPEPT